MLPTALSTPSRPTEAVAISQLRRAEPTLLSKDIAPGATSAEQPHKRSSLARCSSKMVTLRMRSTLSKTLPLGTRATEPMRRSEESATKRLAANTILKYSLANKLWLKVADVAALEGDYYKAIENYEKVAAQSINNNLMRYSVKDYFLKAGICHLATGDSVATSRALEKYRDMDPQFATQREHMLLVDLSEAIEAKSQEQFTDKLFQFDQINKLDKWKTTLLVRIKDTIEEADDEFA